MTRTSTNRLCRSLALLLAVAGLVAWSMPARSCPFCAAVALTFSEEVGNSQVAVIGKLVYLPPRVESDAAAANSLEVPKAKFEVTNVLKGADVLGDKRTIETVYFGDGQIGAKFLIMGIDPPMINWSTPIAVTDRGEKYVVSAIALPKEGADRLAFFQEHLEDADEMLARDAYDEFAKTPYSGVLALKDRMHHDKLVEWIKSPKIPVSRRRLYLTMLGVCGGPQDLPMLEELIKSQDRQTRGALDALVACYLTLKGPDGMPLVEELFLKNKDAEYTDTYATIMALRFHGTEEKIIPRDRLLGGIRLMLDRPQLADLVIPDLARWEDWSVMDRLVELFKTSDDESSWVRVPVINYLRACPLPKAKERLDELAKLDPETVKRANSFFPFPAATAAAAAPANDAAAKADTPKADASKEAGANKDSAAPGEGTAKPATARPDTDKPAQAPPAQEKPAAGAVQGAANAGAAKSDAAAPESVGQLAASRPARETAVLTQPFAKDAAPLPGPPASSTSVFGGLAAAAVILGGAFWAILKGGRHATS
ncbi:MAG: hypothetical protein AB7O59_02555 [Pirellulales bacterium]